MLSRANFQAFKHTDGIVDGQKAHKREFHKFVKELNQMKVLLKPSNDRHHFQFNHTSYSKKVQDSAGENTV